MSLWTRWQEDESFIKWLQEKGYVQVNNNKLHLVMSGGIYLYMWEAWRGGQVSPKK
jgi:hypothetical protein